MALDRLTEDMNFVRNMSDDPKRDDGLSTQEFKSYFDKAGLLIQNFINNKLIPQIESSMDEGALLQQISVALGKKLDKSGGDMTGELNMNGQSIRGLNPPTADDQAANMGFVNQQVKKAAPRNLLDNSDFTNLVNQRGADSYTGTSLAYDRWQTRRITIRTTAEGLHITPNNESGLRYLYQRIRHNLCGKKITIAVDGMPAGGFIKVFNITATEQIASSKELQAGLNVYTAEIPAGYEDGLSILFYVPDNSSCVLKWAAVYEGEYTIDTLPEYQPKGYEQELLICNQYDLSTGEYIGLRKFNTAHNLLDNSDFTNPVNQRGATSYTGSGYTIDRWYSHPNNESVTFKSNGIAIKAKSGTLGWFSQKLDGSKFIGKTCTAAIKLTNGEVVLCTGTFPSSYATSEQVIARTDTDAINVKLFWYEDKTAAFRLRINGTTVTIAWAALYEGEYTAETLPEYQRKGYATELIECQRYYLKIMNLTLFSGHITTGGKDVVLTFIPPVEMRISPTATMKSFNVTVRTVSGYSSVAGSDGASPSRVNAVKYGFAMYLCLSFDSSVGTNNTPCSCHVASGYLELSADL